MTPTPLLERYGTIHISCHQSMVGGWYTKINQLMTIFEGSGGDTTGCVLEAQPLNAWHCLSVLPVNYMKMAFTAP